MFALVRAVVFASLFMAFMLVFLPARVLSAAGVTRPASLGPVELAGTILALAGGALALWCVFTFALVGRGTPAPFDPPRRLVVLGPYRFVRNPMYLGASLALVGGATFYRSLALLGYAAAFLLAMHLIAVGYEERALRRTFGGEYESYRAAVPRWIPRWPGAKRASGIR